MTQSAHCYPAQLHRIPQEDTRRAPLSGLPQGEAYGTCEHHTPDDSIPYPDMLSGSFTKVSKPFYFIPKACHSPRSAALQWCVRTPCPDIFSMDSKELSSISDCFGDQIAIKTPKLNTIWLELIARVLNMLIGLQGDNYYSKVFKRVNYKLWNNTFWVVITPPNQHIASPLAMKERKIKIDSTIIYNIMLIKKQFSSGMMI